MKDSIESILESPDPLSSEKINEVNQIFINELSNGTLDSYYKILSQYIKAKKAQNILTADVSNESGLPESTIKRFENLQVVPKVLTVIKILRAVGLKLTVTPIDK